MSLTCESRLRFLIVRAVAAMSQVEECQSTPVLAETSLQQQGVSSTSLGMIAEHTLLESCTRLSISLEQNGLFKVFCTLVRVWIMQFFPAIRKQEMVLSAKRSWRFAKFESLNNM